MSFWQSFQTSVRASSYDAASAYMDLGYFPVPLRLDDKRPAIPYAEMTAPDLSYWQNGFYGVGLRTGPAGSGLVVADLENHWDAEIWKTAHPYKVVTLSPRGQHCWYRAGEVSSRLGVQGPEHREPWDFRANGHLITVPPTIIGGVQYRFLPGCKPVPVGELDTWENGWLPAKPAGLAHTSESRQNVLSYGLAAAEAYISQITARAGEAGDRATFRAACKLAMSAQSETDVLEGLRRWNQTNADPPWPDAALEHKAARAWVTVHEQSC